MTKLNVVWQMQFTSATSLVKTRLLRSAERDKRKIKIIIPLNMPSNDDDRRQRRKQGGVVGAAASKTRMPLKA